MSIESSSIEQHENKLTFLLKVASDVVALTAMIWATFFIIIQDWLGAFTESILIVMGCLGYAHTRHNNTKIIAYVYLPILFFVMCFICIFYDMPNAIVSRSNNH